MQMLARMVHVILNSITKKRIPLVEIRFFSSISYNGRKRMWR
ncbi:hypothetical protein BAOM_4162 [Peribacillus asahii]|uniref:Uncharacterized protein n=1 Tax=Peribacillus asahii TaxID=228899 RepID=A0A3T0KWR8_9BACI|nr:hypothetical protein BAOM_4162 [Peribacillus asahii]